MLRIEAAYKSFGNQHLFENCSLTIDQPGLYVLWGKSGCGKSTLLNIIAGYDHFDQGTLKCDEKIMTIFQNYELIDELTVRENIFLGRKETVEDRNLLEQLRILSLLDQYPRELSGGQKQRAGIARALTAHPSMICCDEPTESLDIENRQIVLKLLKEYANDHIVLMSTHQEEVVYAYADVLIRIRKKKLDIHIIHEVNGNVNHIQADPFDLSVIKKYIHKIIRPKNHIFLIIFLLFLCTSQSLSIFGQVLFSVPDTTRVLNADMLYINSDDPDAFASLEMPAGEKIISFADVMLSDTEYQTNIYPFVENEDNLPIEGEEPGYQAILINQNAAKALFANQWKNQKLILSYRISPYVFTMDVQVCGVIQEEDTQALNIYYNLDDILEYMNSVSLPSGESVRSYFDGHNTLYQIDAGYDLIGTYEAEISRRNDMTAVSPLYDERMEKQKNSEIYQILFTALIWVTVILTAVFIWLYSMKEMVSHQKAFTILISQNLSITVLKKQVLKEKMLPVLTIAGIDLACLVFLHYFDNNIQIIFSIMQVLVQTVICFLSVYLSLKRLKQENIGAMMKEEG